MVAMGCEPHGQILGTGETGETCGTGGTCETSGTCETRGEF